MNTVRLLLQPTPTPSTGGSPGESSVPSFNHLSTGILVFLLVVAATLIAGTLVAVMLDRSRTDGSTGRRSAPMTRSMLAVLLVGTLLLVALGSLGVDDTNTRNLLLGGIVATSGAAVAFYFSSRNADTAREDLMNATLGTQTVEVPKFTDMKLGAATDLAAKRGLVLIVDPAAGTTDDWTITAQDVREGVRVQRSTQVGVTATAPAT